MTIRLPAAGVTIRFSGGDGRDLLTGGGGNDFIIGGAGDDVIRFSRGDGQDTIKGFVEGGTQDEIFLTNFGLPFDTFAEVIAAGQQQGADVLFDFGNGDELLFLNSSLADFTAADFGF